MLCSLRLLFGGVRLPTNDAYVARVRATTIETTTTTTTAVILFGRRPLVDQSVLVSNPLTNIGQSKTKDKRKKKEERRKKNSQRVFVYSSAPSLLRFSTSSLLRFIAAAASVLSTKLDLTLSLSLLYLFQFILKCH